MLPMLRRRVSVTSISFVALFVLLLSVAPYAQKARARPQAAPSATPAAGGGVQVAEIAPKFYLVSNASANLVLMTGDDASFVAGVQQPALVAAAVAKVRDLKAPPVKYVFVADDEHAADYGDGGWGQRGAMAIAHEAMISRLRKPGTDGPTLTFSQVVQLHIKGEDTHLIHDRAGFSAADVAIHFEHSGILYAGPWFTSDGYPRVETANGGKISGMVDSADFFANNFAGSPAAIEPIVPGRGPVATIRDLAEYRDMLRTVRDRVRTAAKSGKSLQDVLAAKPTAEFDAKWGHGPITAEKFVSMVYESVTKE